MKKRKIFIVFVTIVVIGSITFIFKCCGKNTRDAVTEQLVMYATDESHIVMPVVIDGVTYRFGWDTGASSSAITEELADILGVKSNSTTSVVGLRKGTKNPRIRPITEPLSINLGSLEIGSSFIVWDTMSSGTFKLDGVIGKDIINKYYWLVDFNSNTITLSTDSLKAEPTENMQKYEFPLAYDTSHAMFCVVRTNDSTELKLTLDTGLGSKVAMGKDSSYLLMDMGVVIHDSVDITTISDFLCKHLTTNTTMVSLHVSGEESSGFICNGSVFNGYKTDLMFCGIEQDSSHLNSRQHLQNERGFSSGIYLSSGFVRRFNQMYFDPFKGVITLCLSDQISKRYDPRDIERFIDSYLEN